MEKDRLNVIQPVIFALLTGLLITSAFFNGCSVTKASMERPIILSDSKTIEVPKLVEIDKPVRVIDHRYDSIRDGIKELNSLVGVRIKKGDSVAYNVYMMLKNQNISLSNEAKIIELLVNKEKEVKNLRHENKTLTQKTAITKSEKTDAIIFREFQKFGKAIVLSLIGIMVTLIVGIFVLGRYISKQVY